MLLSENIQHKIQAFTWSCGSTPGLWWGQRTCLPSEHLRIQEVTLNKYLKSWPSVDAFSCSSWISSTSLSEKDLPAQIWKQTRNFLTQATVWLRKPFPLPFPLEVSGPWWNWGRRTEQDLLLKEGNLSSSPLAILLLWLAGPGCTWIR